MKTLLLLIIVTSPFGLVELFNDSSEPMTSSIEKVDIESTYGDLNVTFENISDVVIDHNITVNGQDAGEKMEITKKERNGTLYIDIELDFDDFEEMVTIKTQSGERIRLTSSEFEDQQEKWSGWNKMNFGYDVDGSITIKVPHHYSSKIESTYGTIDLVCNKVPSNFQLEAISTYGDVDIAIPPSTDASLKMSTSYGLIYTDHDIEIPNKKKNPNYQFGSQIKAKMGSGTGKIVLEATYQNIYLRKI